MASSVLEPDDDDDDISNDLEDENAFVQATAFDRYRTFDFAVVRVFQHSAGLGRKFVDVGSRRRDQAVDDMGLCFELHLLLPRCRLDQSMPDLFAWAAHRVASNETFRSIGRSPRSTAAATGLRMDSTAIRPHLQNLFLPSAW